MNNPSAQPFSFLARLALLLLLPLGLAGCGYTQQELFPPDIHSVAVPIFANRTFYRGVEFDLTQALVKEIELRTPFKTMPEDRAQTLLQGTIVSCEQRTLSTTRDAGLPQEMELRIAVDFTWKDARTGKILRDRRGFAAVGRYIPTTPIGETLSAGQHAAVQKLATDIVSTLRADW